MNAAQHDLHDHDTWVLGDVLSKQAAGYGERTWIRLVDGECLNFSMADRVASQVARVLLRYGVAKGDAVAVFLPNSVEYCYAWLGIPRAGAVSTSDSPFSTPTVYLCSCTRP